MTVRSQTTYHPACPLILFRAVGMGGWLTLLMGFFLFSYHRLLLPMRAKEMELFHK